MTKKKVEKSCPQKTLNFRVANFGINYLRHFSINFGNSCAYLAAIFLNFFNSPNIRKTPKNTCYSAP